MSRLELWLAGWIAIACGTVMVLTGGFCIPTWDMDWAVRMSEKAMLAERAKRQESHDE